MRIRSYITNTKTTRFSTCTLGSALILGLSSTASADYKGLETVVAPVTQHGWQTTDSRALWTVRLYAVFSQDDDHMLGVYGDTSNPASIQTSDTAGFYQCSLGGDTAASINSAAAEVFPSLLSDTWVTIGQEDSGFGESTNDIATIGIDYSTFNSGGSSLSFDNGTWFVTPDMVQGGTDQWTDTKVLLGQFVVSMGCTVSGTLNVLWKDVEGELTHEVIDETFTAVALPEIDNADFNGDGNQDALWYTYSEGRYAVELRDGLTVLDDGYIGGSTDQWYLRGVADFNGDGNSDMLYYNRANQRYWAALKDGVSNVSSGSGYIGGGVPGWELRALGDFNGDGNDDILWHNTNNNKYWAALRDGFLAVAGSGYISPGLPSSSPRTIWGIADMNSDGFDDLIWFNPVNNRHWVDLMGADAVVGDGGYVSEGTAGFVLEAVADFNNDSELDLFMHDTGTGQHWVGLLESLAIVDSDTVSAGLEGWNILDVDDYNGDGMADTMYINTANGRYWMALRDGLDTLQGGYIGGGHNWRLASTTDYNGDGTADLVFKKVSISRYWLALRNGFSLISAGWMRPADPDWLLLH